MSTPPSPRLLPQPPFLNPPQHAYSLLRWVGEGGDSDDVLRASEEQAGRVEEATREPEGGAGRGPAGGRDPVDHEAPGDQLEPVWRRSAAVGDTGGGGIRI